MLKTRKSISKRFVIKKNCVLRNAANLNHFLQKKSRRTKLNLKKQHFLFSSYRHLIKYI